MNAVYLNEFDFRRIQVLNRHSKSHELAIKEMIHIKKELNSTMAKKL